MSSLKDIMDVDVEPLESQAYRRKEAAQQQASQPSIDPSSQSPSPQLDDTKGKLSMNHRRSNRVSKSSTQSTISRPNSSRRRSSGAGEAMDFSAYQGGGSNQRSISGSPSQTSSRGGMEPMADVLPIKYTPVTGRISRAKKGIPVHTCDDCRKTFTRAEHLRRHKLSHGKPAYPCTFEDCERTFHRPDLLARHLNRHETQGEKAYKSSDPRSRASSSASESAPLKLEPTPHGISMGLGQMSPENSITPRTSAGTDHSAVAPTFNTLTGNFQPVDFSSGSSHRGSVSQAQVTDVEVYTAASPGLIPPRTYAEMTPTFNVRPMPEFSEQDPYRATNSSFQGLYAEEVSSFHPYSPPHALPLLRIPEEPYMPSLSYTHDNSPWCSSASDSTYSESSRTGRTAHRGRSGSLATAPEWSVPVPNAQWSHGMANTAQDLRSPPYETMMESYDAPYTPPRMSPPSRQLLDVPAYNLGGYYMESVASPSRLSDPRLAVIDRRSKELVGSQQLDTLMNIETVISSPSQPAISNLDTYLSLYWNNFDKLFPLIHRGTYIQNQNLLLTFAMAAIGTQYHTDPEARNHGVDFNAYCTNIIPVTFEWSIQIMQAILLTEIFTRFRGIKTTVRLSRQFEELYNRLSNPSPTSDTNTTPTTTRTSNVLSHHFNTRTRSQDIQSNWLLWVDTESRQRLLCLCFIFDIQQAMYHQQKRARPYMDSSTLYTPCSEVLWDSTNAADWATNTTGSNIGQPLNVMQHQHTQENRVEPSYFAQSLNICFLTSQLPGHVDPNHHYPNDHQIHNIYPTILELVTLSPGSSMAYTHIALYHTPLSDLLAVSGDTWIFSQKITNQIHFREAQSRLRTWSSSLAAATATHYACRILLSEFSAPYIPSSNNNTAQHSPDLSHYWSLNIAALICWAFGHRVSGNSGAFTALDFDTSPEASGDVRLDALMYLSSMVELDNKDLLTSKATLRRKTSCVIDAVRARLEIDSVGGHCMSLVDSICVLKRLNESGRGKWF
ncbi:hypothetical protein BCIN_04g01650 [Botrytis cinerea B05.10]|uniref:C2H2-type domain-containing protein n=1 Tax=Botryotinia fuckeliana (strain B05.10) TaxID=332648 RepID=A0A384JED3_BOTFB|nr:hypothetical protein BCIN_04g01650 [Botrytis cinerea B05.10]ATZ48956.1 hypothetical protein BCIN_04g01650 [Botrytis cinerea B05.10]